MNPDERIQLERLLREYDVEDTTQKIRRLKHSRKIREDVKLMEGLKRQYSRLSQTNRKQFDEIMRNRCSFLYANYTNIFNRNLKGELNLQILDKFLQVLEKIEKGLIDQHEGSVEIGKLLKELYIDSALRQEKKQEKQKKYNKPVKNISWKDYKRNNDI